MGAALGISANKISRIETGRIGLQADEVAALLGFYQVAKPDREELLELVRRAAEPGWWQVQGPGCPSCGRSSSTSSAPPRRSSTTSRY